jgi:cellulose synthase operon protein B
VSPGKIGTWTVISAPSMSELQLGMLEMSDNLNWQKLDGRLVLLDRSKKRVEAFPSSQVMLVETQPVSLANYRLIAANWLSNNILSYAVLFALLSILLGITTSGVLKMFGRY